MQDKLVSTITIQRNNITAFGVEVILCTNILVRNLSSDMKDMHIKGCTPLQLVFVLAFVSSSSLRLRVF